MKKIWLCLSQPKTKGSCCLESASLRVDARVGSSFHNLASALAAGNVVATKVEDGTEYRLNLRERSLFLSPEKISLQFVVRGDWVEVTRDWHLVPIARGLDLIYVIRKDDTGWAPPPRKKAA